MVARQYDMDPDRKVLNTSDLSEKEDFVIKTDEQKRRLARSSRYESVVFTDESIDFSNPFEDEALINGLTKPTVSAVYDTGYDGKPNVYDPSKDYVKATSHTDSFDRTSQMGPLTGDSFSTPGFFKSRTDMIIGCVIAGLIILLEIIAFIIVF